MLLLELGVGGVVCCLFWQDWKNREVSVYLLVALQTLLIWRFLALELNWQFLAFNGLFIILQLSVLWAYWYFRFRNIRLTDGLGLGDILLWFIAAWAFSPLNFLVFYLFSMLAILGFYVVWNSIKPRQYQGTIPLAGMQGIFLFIGILLDHFTAWSSISDELIQQLFLF